jgi:hypothetical protein
MFARPAIVLALAACGSPHPATPNDASTSGDATDAALGDAPPIQPTTFALFAEPQLAASDTVLNQIIVVGTHDSDGSIATNTVVLSFDRPGAGSFTRPMVTLGNLGAVSEFVACNASVPGCLGTLTLTAALASNPTVVVATLQVELVAPIDVNPAKRCLTGGNVLDLHGNDQIFTGDATLTDATWDAGWAFEDSIIFNVTPNGATDQWQLAFDVQRDAPLFVPDVYANADKASPQTAVDEALDHPAMLIRGFGHDCDTVTGDFQVEDYAVNNSGAQNITISFEQHCNGDPTTMVSGCLHFQPTMMPGRAPTSGTHYEVRIAESELDANGHTKHEMFVYGKHADGTTAEEPVVLGIDRASAGTLLASSLALGPLGARTYFTPCDGQAADCLGPAMLTVALASDPTTIVATRAIQIEHTGHISTAAPCLAGGNIMYVDGNDGIRDGMLTVTDGIWDVYQKSATDFAVNMSPYLVSEGLDWTLTLDTLTYGGTLAPGVYAGAEQSHHSDAMHPGMNVYGNSRECGALTGAFEILDFNAANGTFTVSFEEHCNGEAPLLEGCFHREN